MTESDLPKRKRLNAEQKRALKTADLQKFLQQYGRKAQKGQEPNDRRYKVKIEKKVKRLKPEDFDRFLRDDEENSG